MINNLTASDVQQLVHYFNDLLSPTITYVRKEEIIREVVSRYKIKKRDQYGEVTIKGIDLVDFINNNSRVQQKQS